MIEVAGLSKRYGNIQALDQVSFSVQKGQIVGFLGANGAGKTTTMDIICGCIGADFGAVRVAGFDVTEQPIEAKRRLGYLPETPPLHNDMRVEEYLRYAAELHRVPRNELTKRTQTVIERLSLGDVRSRIVGNLSKGYRQRVGLGQALIHDPEVLILDEPTEGLDPNQIAHIRELIKSFAGEHTIILSSHILSEVQNTCDHVVIIHKGHIVQQGTCSELTAGLEAGSIYRVRVAKDASRLVTALGRLDGVSGARMVQNSGDMVEFAAAKDESALDDVARTVVDGGYGLRELSLKTRSLEEVFFQLTK